MALTLENTTGSPITIATLGGLVIPAATTIDVTSRVTEEELARVYEREIKAYVLAGTIKVDDGSLPGTVGEQNDIGDMLTAREASFLLGSVSITENEFTPIALQTVFALSATYLFGGFVILTVNGLEVDRGASYTISGSTLTWLNFPYTLAATDKLIIKFENP